MREGPSAGSVSSRRLAISLACGAAGLVAGIVVYTLLNPVLEGRDDALEDLQGLLSLVVPLLAVAGAAIGWWAAGRRR